MKLEFPKEYFAALALLFITFIVIVNMTPDTLNSRGEIIFLYVSNSIIFLVGSITNLLFLMPIDRLKIRLISPGILTFLLSLLIWRNSEFES